MKSDFSDEIYYSEKERELAEAKHDGYNSGYDEGYRDGMQECMDIVLKAVDASVNALNDGLRKIQDGIWK